MATKNERFDPLPDSFLELPDVPNSYAGQAGKAATVKPSEDGIEFKAAGGGGELWASPVDSDALQYSSLGMYPILELVVGDSCTFGFRLPSGFARLTEAKLIMIPDATETVVASFVIGAAAVGESWYLNTSSTLSQTLAVTANEMTEWEIRPFFPGMAAGDYIGAIIGSEIDKLRIVGLAVRYD